MCRSVPCLAACLLAVGRFSVLVRLRSWSCLSCACTLPVVIFSVFLVPARPPRAVLEVFCVCLFTLYPPVVFWSRGVQPPTPGADARFMSTTGWASPRLAEPGARRTTKTANVHGNSLCVTPLSARLPPHRRRRPLLPPLPPSPPETPHVPDRDFVRAR